MAHRPSYSGSSRKRARPSNAFANDEFVLNAAINLLGTVGIEGVNFNSIAKEAGLSYTVLSKRYAKVDSLIVDVWNQIGNETLLDPIHNLVFDLVTGTATDSSNIEKMLAPDLKTRAALEILMASGTDVEFHELIASSRNNYLAEISIQDPGLAARYTVLYVIILGAICYSMLYKIDTGVVTQGLAHLASLLKNSHEDLTMPSVDASHLSSTSIGTQDRDEAAILLACLDLISKQGFANTTTKQISTTSKISEGKIFSLYKSKVDIFLAAIKAQASAAIEKNVSVATKWSEDFGLVIANSLFFREYMRDTPNLHRNRGLQLEILRLSWHRPDIRDRHEQDIKFLESERVKANENIHPETDRSAVAIETAIAYGVLAVPLIYKDAWNLPFTVAIGSIYAVEN
ncbi:MAG: hypothetical protein RLZZ330_599 [Actinomycetota bacterium]|jgi:AcrR family transcriptional regulator